MMRACLRFVAATLAASGMPGAEKNPVTLAVVPAAVTVKPGEVTTVRVQFDIEAPYHINAIEPQINAQGMGPTATAVAVKTPEVFTFAGGLKTSKPAHRYDKNFEMDLFTLSGRAWIDVPFKAAPALKSGPHRAVLIVSYQACSDETCLLPTEGEAEFTLTVSSASTRERR